MTNLIIFSAKYLYLVAIALFIGYGFMAKDKKKFLTLSFFTFLLAYLLSALANDLYNNPRPFVVSGIAPLIAHGADNGFPSDHTLLTGALAAVVTVFSPYLGAVLWLLALIVGIARVLAGVHHSIDIVGSIIIAIVSVVAVYYFLKYYASPEK